MPETKCESNGQTAIEFADNKPTTPETLRVVSLFSGCGGFDLGFHGKFDFRQYHFPKNRFEVVYANDIDTNAAKVYGANERYFSTACDSRDIRQVSVEEIPDFDIMLAGFPCQPFSNAGSRKGVHDENGRGTLFEECERILRFKSLRGKGPMAFVFENVRGIMSSKMPDGTPVPDEIVNRMEKLGFTTSYKLIKASDYGVPSRRFRLIMVGFREDLGEFDFTAMDNIIKKYRLPNEKNDPYELYLGSILSDIPKDALNRKEYWSYSPSGQYMVDRIGPCLDGRKALREFPRKTPLSEISPTISDGRSWKNMNPEDMSKRFRKIWDNPQKYRAPNFYRRFALGEINGTITASAQPENCGITHPFEDRRFSIREVARIQSFPDDFMFPYTSIQSAYKVIGNAVPPILGWVVAKALEEQLSPFIPN